VTPAGIARNNGTLVMFQHHRHAGDGGGHFKVRPRAGAFGLPYVLTIVNLSPAEVALSIGFKTLEIRRFGGAGIDVIRASMGSATQCSTLHSSEGVQPVQGCFIGWVRIQDSSM
jgi:hypothetical protein